MCLAQKVGCNSSRCHVIIFYCQEQVIWVLFRHIFIAARCLYIGPGIVKSVLYLSHLVVGLSCDLLLYESIYV